MGMIWQNVERVQCSYVYNINNTLKGPYVACCTCMQHSTISLTMQNLKLFSSAIRHFLKLQPAIYRPIYCMLCFVKIVNKLKILTNERPATNNQSNFLNKWCTISREEYL